MKGVLMSIKARHNRNIETGLKISELRTMPPNLPTPFKVFTYESGLDGRRKVVNEWICDNITTWRICMGIPTHLPKAACISAGEIYEYSKHGLKDVSEMHISNLKIYDKPKEIWEFRKPCNADINNCRSCINSKLVKADVGIAYLCCRADYLTRPPQSMCYVETL